VALVQSFVRIDAEVQGLRFVADKLLAVQMPVLSWWAVVTVITRASTTITVLAIFTVAIALTPGPHGPVGDVMFVSLRNHAGSEARTGGQASSTTCSWRRATLHGISSRDGSCTAAAPPMNTFG